MPLERHPSRRIKTQIEQIGSDAKSDGVGSTQKVTVETIEAVMPNNQVRVLGVNVPITGSGVSLAAGQRIGVAWTAGAPTAAIFHHAQSAQFVPFLAGGAPVVEELFVASAAGVSDVYFRNYDHVAALKLTAITGATYTMVKWGQNADHFLARRQGGSGQVWDHFKMSRNPQHPLASHTTPAVHLVATRDLLDGAASVDTVTLTFSGGAPSPQTVALTNSTVIAGVTGLQSAGGFVTFSVDDDNNGGYVALDDQNHIVAVFTLNVFVRVGLNPGGPFYDVTFTYPIILDLTSNSVLFNAYRTASSGIDSAVGMGGVLHLLGSDLAGVTNTLDADGQNRSTLFFPAYTARLGFLTGGAFDSLFLSAGYQRFLTTAEGFPHFGIVRNAGVVIHPSGAFPQPTTLVPLTAPVEALLGSVGLLPTGPAHEHSGPLFNRHHIGFISETNSAALASFDLNTRADVDPSTSHFNGLGFIGLAPDFLYVIEDETNAQHRFFVRAWNFKTGAVTLSSAAAGFPPEDTALKSVRTLAALPAGLTLSTLFNPTASFQAINDSTILSPLGRFKKT